MSKLIVFVGFLQVALGVLVYAGAKSAIHEILGSISFGMGVLSIGIGIAVAHLAAIKAALESRQ